MACFITAGQTAADAHEQGQQSCPLHQKALTAVSLSTALQQEWVPNKGRDFKWISEWTLNVWTLEWSVWQHSQELSCWRACQKQWRAQGQPTAAAATLWPDEGMIFGRTFSVKCQRQWSSVHGLTFMRNEKRAQVYVCNIQEVSPVRGNLWTSNMDNFSGIKERHSGAGQGPSVTSGQTWTISHLNITCHNGAPLHCRIILYHTV